MAAPIPLLDRAISALESTTSPTEPLTEAPPAQDPAAPSPSAPASAGTPAPAPAPALPFYQSQLVNGFLRSRGNEIVFLPTGLGECAVVDAIAAATLARYPDKHVVVCVVRPAQALSHAERLRKALHVPVAAFCGGDFLYDFPAAFAKHRVLVFTAGLLMRLAKLGTYQLSSASLLVLHDAFSAVRNHPMNTLVREYYPWKGPGGEAAPPGQRPRILGVVLPQLQQLQRPFDKLRQLVRKLAHSAQAGVLVPTGPALEALAGRVHRAHVAVHAYDLTPEERELGEALQTHALLVWDTLHTFGLNHFGRLIHFPPANGSGGNHSGSSPAIHGVGESPSHATRLAASLAAAGGSPGSPAAFGSPAAVGSPVEVPRGTAAPSNAAPYSLDPIHHDWEQIELMVRHSIACSEALPPADGDPEGPHHRSAVAIEVMRHVLLCAQAVRTGMELGIGPCLAAALPALRQLSEVVAPGAEDVGVDARLREKVREVLPGSPLLQWVAARGPEGVAAAAAVQPSRLATLLEVLREVLRHAEEESLFGTEVTLRRVAVVAGSADSAAALATAITDAGDLSATVERWTDGSNAPEAATDAGQGNETDRITAEDNQESNNKDQQLSVSVLTSEEAQSPAGRDFIAASDEAVWFSAGDVLHAAGFEYESAAFGVFSRESAVGVGSDALPGPECHVLATGGQTAAWMEVCRADQLLMAAMQLVQAGDASFEGYLGQLAAGGASGGLGGGGNGPPLSVPPASAALHTLCLGLCGRPPVFSVSRLPGAAAGGRDAGHLAEVSLPEEMLLPGSHVLAGLFGSGTTSGGHTEQAWHFRGRPEASESEARDSAAEEALTALIDCGLVAAYWQTRALMLQSAQRAAAEAAMAAASAAAHPAPGMPSLRVMASSGVHSMPALPPSPFVDSAGPVATGPAGVPQENLICSVCGIVTTSEGHLREHMAGRRHQKNLERLQQQGMMSFRFSGGAAAAITAAAAAAAAAAAKDGSDSSSDKLQDSTGTTGTGSVELPSPRPTSGTGATTPPSAPSPGPATPPPPLATLSTIDRLPSTLSDVFLRRSTSLHRNPSGNVYDGFPCVRVGDVVLPSSMDLRAFLEEMQQAGELDLAVDPLPPIGEEPAASPRGTLVSGGRGTSPMRRGNGGGGTGSGSGGGSGSSGPLGDGARTPIALRGGGGGSRGSSGPTSPYAGQYHRHSQGWSPQRTPPRHARHTPSRFAYDGGNGGGNHSGGGSPYAPRGGATAGGQHPHPYTAVQFAMPVPFHPAAQAQMMQMAGGAPMAVYAAMPYPGAAPGSMSAMAMPGGMGMGVAIPGGGYGVPSPGGRGGGNQQQYSGYYAMPQQHSPGRYQQYGRGQWRPPPSPSQHRDA